VIGEGYNEAALRRDPTAHAEIVAMRRAGRNPCRASSIARCIHFKSSARNCDEISITGSGPTLFDRPMASPAPGSSPTHRTNLTSTDHASMKATIMPTMTNTKEPTSMYRKTWLIEPPRAWVAVRTIVVMRNLDTAGSLLSAPRPPRQTRKILRPAFYYRHRVTPPRGSTEVIVRPAE
jgi:hypothetical protein